MTIVAKDVETTYMPGASDWAKQGQWDIVNAIKNSEQYFKFFRPQGRFRREWDTLVINNGGDGSIWFLSLLRRLERVKRSDKEKWSTFEEDIKAVEDMIMKSANIAVLDENAISSGKVRVLGNLLLGLIEGIESVLAQGDGGKLEALSSFKKTTEGKAFRDSLREFIQEGKEEVGLKGLFSLGTQLAISVEKGWQGLKEELNTLLRVIGSQLEGKVTEEQREWIKRFC